MKLRALIGLFVVACVAPAFAGVVDTPLPTLPSGKKLINLFQVTGVMKRYIQPFDSTYPYLETAFVCTSLEPTKNIDVLMVQVFGDNGGAPLNDAMAGSGGIGGLGPGATAIIETGDIEMIGQWPGTNYSIIWDTANIIHLGSARILSTSKNLMCNAFLAPTADTFPMNLTPLPVVKTKTQHGS